MLFSNLNPFRSQPVHSPSTEQTEALNRSSIASMVTSAIRAPFVGIYYAGKGASKAVTLTGRGIYTIGYETYTFPKRLRRAELGPMLFTAGGIAAFALQRKVPFISPAGVAGSVLSIYLAANIIYGIAIPVVAIGSGIALFEHYNPGTVKSLYERSIDHLRVCLKIATPKQIREMKDAAATAEKAAKEAANKISKAEAAIAKLEEAKTTAQTASASSTTYSKLAFAAGLSLTCVGEGLSALGESTTEAGLVATAQAFDLNEDKQKQMRIAVKTSSTVLAAIATVTIAINTCASLPFVAAPILVSAAAVALDLSGGLKAQSNAHQIIETSELSKIAKDDSEASKFKKADASLSLAKGIVLEVLGHTASNLGFGLVQSNGGMLLALTSRLASRTFMPKAAASLYGDDTSSYLDSASEYAALLYKRGQNVAPLAATLASKFKEAKTAKKN